MQPRSAARPDPGNAGRIARFARCPADGLRACSTTGGLYNRSPTNIARAGREFAVGNLYISRTITGTLIDRQPFGGFRFSGLGSKAGGPDARITATTGPKISSCAIRASGGMSAKIAGPT